VMNTQKTDFSEFLIKFSFYLAITTNNKNER